MNETSIQKVGSLLEQNLYYSLKDYPDNDIALEMDKTNPDEYTLTIFINPRYNGLASTYTEDTSDYYAYVCKYEPNSNITYAFVSGDNFMVGLPLTKKTTEVLFDIITDPDKFFTKTLIHKIELLNKAFKEVLNAIETDSDFDELISDDYPFHLSFDEMVLEVNKWCETMKRL